ncbi:hypothetical protein GCM10009715_32620 [Paeniglutamicibacter psychrophenolicus]|uniref:Uncharacterized protein n=1 Tax=Paeniglutamicibacter psychrophenolicus TaxID=257454 RepID=A0ABS4W9I5_9MICC|nr:DUF3237 domain-containing protein [Paeniglutamicibacter psychrophenolicus]MBP2372850.1 hypothetical protein [Paeniglutamicibacter psychrophenolicus]
MTHVPSLEPLRSPSAPALEFRFRIDAHVDPEIPIDDRSAGELEFIPITGGSVEGALNGTVTPGGDWCLGKDPSTYRVEARYGLRLEDGGYVDVHNIGMLDESRFASDAGEGAPYFMTNPVFRTAAPGLDWLNRSVFVGQAQVLEGLTRIDVFEVVFPRQDGQPPA